MMHATTNRSGRRPAFTLIELLVVIAIISILMALTAAAVFPMISKGPELKTKVEEEQLSMGVNRFKTEFSVSYVPSRIVLRKDGKYDSTNADHVETVAYLQALFGKSFNVSTPINWTGDANTKGDDGKGNFVLNADQSLVFFLGGIPISANGAYGATGFSTDPANPAKQGGTRKGPYFEFDTARLKPGANGFLVYVDPWNKNQPYLYLSSYKSGNDYRDDAKTYNVKPYQEANGQFVNPRGFQIISAGKDGLFGPGGAYDPRAGVTDAKGRDDQANFGGRTLAAPAN
jgi:prepilin-type N-terminal cleavage/methylation domain-containing protein